MAEEKIEKAKTKRDQKGPLQPDVPEEPQVCGTGVLIFYQYLLQGAEDVPVESSKPLGPDDIKIAEIQAAMEAKLLEARKVEEHLIAKFAESRELDAQREKAVFDEFQILPEIDIPVHRLDLDIDRAHLQDRGLLHIKGVMHAKDKKTEDKVAQRTSIPPQRLETAVKLKERISLTERQRRATERPMSPGEQEFRVSKAREFAENKRKHLLEQITSITERNNSIRALADLQRTSNYPKNQRYIGIANSFSVHDRNLEVNTETAAEKFKHSFKRGASQGSDDVALAEMAAYNATKRGLPMPAETLEVSDPKLLFVAKPSSVEFCDYTAGGEYFAYITLTNVNAFARRIQLLPPATPYFSSEGPIYVQDQAWIAPGVSCKIKVWFSPDSNGNFADQLVVFTQAAKLVIPLRGRRFPPLLSVPRTINLGTCVVDDLLERTINCVNSGSPGRFFLMELGKFMTAIGWTEINVDQVITISNEELHNLTDGWGSAVHVDELEASYAADAANTESNSSNISARNSGRFMGRRGRDLTGTDGTSDLAPFTVFPQRFVLRHEESVQIIIKFRPKTVEVMRKSFVLLCDNLMVYPFELVGEGCEVSLRLVSYQTSVKAWNSNAAPVMTPANGPLTVLIFPDLTMNGQTSRCLEIKNESSIPVQYSWTLKPLEPWFQVADKKKAAAKLPSPDLQITRKRDDKPTMPVVTCFSISPREGRFEAGQTLRFTALFCPTAPQLERVTATISVHNVPDTYKHVLRALKAQTRGELDAEIDTQSEIRSARNNKQVLTSFPLLSYTLQGQGHFCTVTAEPTVLLLPPLSVGLPLAVNFVLKNQSLALCPFKWHPIRSPNWTLTIEPSQGVLHPGEDHFFKVTVLCSVPGEISAVLLCDLTLGPLLNLPLRGLASGPMVCFAVAAVDFGLINFGHSDPTRMAEFIIANRSAMPAAFALCQSGYLPPPFPNPQPDVDATPEEALPASGILHFDPWAGVLPPKANMRIKVRCAPESVQSFRAWVECHVLHGPTQFMRGMCFVKLFDIISNFFFLLFICLLSSIYISFKSKKRTKLADILWTTR